MSRVLLLRWYESYRNHHLTFLLYNSLFAQMGIAYLVDPSSPVILILHTCNIPFSLL